MRLGALPRVRLATLPTPPRHAPRLPEALGVAAARLGLEAHLVRHGPEHPVAHEGNAALSTLAGARITWTVDPDRASVDPALERLAGDCARRLEVDPAEGEPEILDGCIGPGHGRSSEAGRAAATVAARTEGIVLDPVFTAKAPAALAERAGDDDRPVVFWRTGGGPTAVAAGTLAEGGAL